MTNFITGTPISSVGVNAAFATLDGNASATRVTATGSTTARTLADRFADVVSVRDHGAVGDGVTNDTAAIAAAIAALPAGGGEVIFPQGNYIVSAPTVLPSNITLTGHQATITAADHTLWPGGALNNAFIAVGQSNITIRDLDFVWPRGRAAFHSPQAHLIWFTSCTDVRILNNTADGGSDMTAMVHCSRVLIQGNRHNNFCNCAYDSWGDLADFQVIGNWCSVLNEADAGLACISFTGTFDATPRNPNGLVCVGNIIYADAPSVTAISLNATAASAGSISQFVIANNKVVTRTASNVWGVLIYGNGQKGAVHDNHFEGAGAFAAVYVNGDCSRVSIHDNVAVNWQGGANGIFRAIGPNCTIVNNRAYDCSSPLIGASDATTVIYGNSTGADSSVTFASGPVNLPAATVTSLSSTGDVTVGTNTTSRSTFHNGPAASLRMVAWQTAGVNRWAAYGMNGAESGGNAGTDFALYACSDAGALLFAPIAITRSTGLVTLAKGVAISGAASTIDQAIIGANTPAAASVTQLNLTTSAGPNIRSGAGAASGTQPKGSLWMRTDGGVGTTMYVSQGAGTWNPVAGV